MDETKKDRQKILTQIRDSIMKNPKTMYELSKEIGSNWDTIRQNVILLQELGVVKIENQKVIYVPNSNRDMREDTIAGLPIDELVIRKVNTLAKKFIDAWETQTKEKLGKTILQKALVEIAENFKELSIPRGWYLYGKVVLVKVSEESIKNQKNDYDFSKEVKDIKLFNEKIIEIAKKYQNMSTDQVVEEQYINHNKKLYLLKKQISEALCTWDLQEKKNEICKLLYELVFHFELKKSDEFSQEVFGILKDAITILVSKIQEEENQFESLRMVLIDLFKSVWWVIATYNLYSSREGNLGRSDEIVNLFLYDKATSYRNDFIDQCQFWGNISS